MLTLQATAAKVPVGGETSWTVRKSPWFTDAVAELEHLSPVAPSPVTVHESNGDALLPLSRTWIVAPEPVLMMSPEKAKSFVTVIEAFAGPQVTPEWDNALLTCPAAGQF
jgi:hypothetical protein